MANKIFTHILNFTATKSCSIVKFAIEHPSLSSQEFNQFSYLWQKSRVSILVIGTSTLLDCSQHKLVRESVPDYSLGYCMQWEEWKKPKSQEYSCVKGKTGLITGSGNTLKVPSQAAPLLPVIRKTGRICVAFCCRKQPWRLTCCSATGGTEGKMLTKE